MQEFHRFCNALGLALIDDRFETGEDLRTQQAAQCRLVARRERLDDHFIGLLGAAKEPANIKGRVTRTNGRESGELDAIVRKFRRSLGEARRARRRFGGRLLPRLTPDAAAKHSVELIQHHGGQACEDDQLEDLQQRLSQVGPGRICAGRENTI